MLNDKALKSVQACLSDLDELSAGRFIFAENMIGKVLQDISESPGIYGLIAECMKSFNFDKEFNRAKVKLPTKDGYFMMPESKAIVLPLVFCILVDIRDKKLNLRDFLKNYFQSEDIGEFENFSRTVIKPFKDAISYCFGMQNNENQETKQDEELEQKAMQVEQNAKENEEERQQKVKEEIKNEKLRNEKDNQFFEKIIRISNQMLEAMELEKHIKPELKDDLVYLINNLISCAKNNDINNVSAFIVALNYIAKPVKNLRFLYMELKSDLTEYFEN